MIDWTLEKQRVTGPMSVAELRLLESIAHGATTPHALEVGHFVGLSTCALLVGLPENTTLWTVDHHQGDKWTGATETEVFESGVAPFRTGRVALRPLYEPFESACDKLPQEIGFVFYDADHTSRACDLFWDGVAAKLARSCVLAFDDADWEGMATLRERALADGFVVRNVGPLRRCNGDKGNPETMTIEVMDRFA